MFCCRKPCCRKPFGAYENSKALWSCLGADCANSAARIFTSSIVASKNQQIPLHTITLPETNSSPLKNGAWNTDYLLEWASCFREGKYLQHWLHPLITAEWVSGLSERNVSHHLVGHVSHRELPGVITTL